MVADSPATPIAANALAAIEGVRAYLALWVVICHVMPSDPLPRHRSSGEGAVE